MCNTLTHATAHVPPGHDLAICLEQNLKKLCAGNVHLLRLELLDC